MTNNETPGAEFAADFFVAEGTLRYNAPSYVQRPADDELLGLTLAGKFCYVLTPRQMGKSSLMIRTARRLQTQGVKTAIVDLTKIGAGVTIEQWYQGVLAQMKSALRLKIDVAGWWQESAHLSCPQRFGHFLREVILEEVAEPVVVFIDETDSMLALDFRDDFFAAIRAIYNDRAADPVWERLTFVLLGVASPSDLIRDTTRTPFNIGQGIALQEFSRADAAVLETGLNAVYPGQGTALLDHIFHWTSGHPYLTQKLCYEAAKAAQAQGTKTGDPAAIVDALVQTLFLSETARKESNLKFVQDRMLTQDTARAARLRLYSDILRDRPVPDIAQSPLHNTLKLSGLVKAENDVLCVRNEIYRSVFDRAWVRENLPQDRMRFIAAAAVLVAIFAVGLIGYNAWANNLALQANENLNFTEVPQERLHILARLFRLWNPLNPTGYTRDAHDLFFGLSWAEQVALFEQGADEKDLMTVITNLYTTLADVDETGASTPLLIAMRDALPVKNASQTAHDLRTELNAWIMAREFYAAGQMQPSLENYIAASNMNYRNSAVWYEKARVRLEMGQVTEALDELDQVLAQVEQRPEELTPMPEPAETLKTDVTAEPTGPTPTVSTTETMTLATAVPVATPDPDAAGIQSQFRDLGQIRRAVKALIYRYPQAALTLINGAEQYATLQEAGMVATLTPTPNYTPSPTQQQTEDNPIQVFTPQPADTGPTPRPTMTPFQPLQATP